MRSGSLSISATNSGGSNTSPNNNHHSSQQHLTSPSTSKNYVASPSHSKPLRSLHVNVYNQNIGFGGNNIISPTSGSSSGGSNNGGSTTASFGSSILSHETSPQASTPKNSYPNTMSLINVSRTPSGNKNRKLDVGSPKVFRSGQTLSMIPSTPPKGGGTTPTSLTNSPNTAAFKDVTTSPAYRNNSTSIEPRRGIQTSNANNTLGRFPTRNVSASSSSPSKSSATTPSKKSILDELKIDKMRNPLHRPISVHALPQMSNGQFESLFTNNRKLSYSSASAQGKRPTMEDEHFFVKNIEEALNQHPISQFKFHAMFGVFDGHCGSECAEHCKQTLFQHLANNKHFLSDIERAFVEGFDACDMDFRQKLFGSTDDSSFSADEFYSGCTANVCVLRNDDLYVANLGDTRCVLAHKGIAVQLSDDHKPSNKEEKQRIEKNGGIVSFGRVNGALAVSRAFGDFEFKKKNNLLVSVVPDITHFVLTKESDFVLIACDGLWDVMSSGEAIKNIYQFLALYKDPRKACEKLVEKALKDGSMDNVTVILILLRELTKS